MTKICYWRTQLIVMAVVISWFTVQVHGLQERRVSKLDTEIAQSIQKLLNGKPEYRKVTFGVDDAVVVLSGSVELFSQMEAPE